MYPSPFPPPDQLNQEGEDAPNNEDEGRSLFKQKENGSSEIPHPTIFDLYLQL